MDNDNVVYTNNRTYSFGDKNEIMTLVGKWVDLESIMFVQGHPDAESQKSNVLSPVWILAYGVCVSGCTCLQVMKMERRPRQKV